MIPQRACLYLPRIRSGCLQGGNTFSLRAGCTTSNGKSRNPKETNKKINPKENHRNPKETQKKSKRNHASPTPVRWRYMITSASHHGGQAYPQLAPLLLAVPAARQCGPSVGRVEHIACRQVQWVDPADAGLELPPLSLFLHLPFASSHV